ncbi:MAG: hypothetical protein AABX30_02700 [Nanoarchaeota archaeon]
MYYSEEENIRYRIYIDFESKNRELLNRDLLAYIQEQNKFVMAEMIKIKSRLTRLNNKKEDNLIQG